MDPYPYDRRSLGQPTAGSGAGDHHWYPSSPPPPPPGGSYYNPSYPHPYPQQPQFQHQQHPMAMAPPHLPPPYHGQPSPMPPPPPPTYPHHQFPPPPRPHYPVPPPHQHPPPPPQAWGNPSWQPHQGWEYPERNISYNNEEDWATRAKAWATFTSGPENQQVQSHFTSVSRADEQSYTYQDQYEQTGGPRDVQQPPYPQSSNHLPAGFMDPSKQVNHLHGSTTFSSGSSYGAGYKAADEITNTKADHIAYSQKSYGPISSVYEQEVPYSYSSTPGNREAVHQSEGLQIPQSLPAPSVQGHHSQSALPVQMISAEQTHFSNHGQSSNFIPDACDQPLIFERRHDSDRESHLKYNYGHAGPSGAVGMMEHDPMASSGHNWTPSTAPAVGFPQIPIGQTGTQFDPTLIPQASMSVQPSPVFGGIPASSFHPSVPPVSAPYGLGPGSSLHSAAFSGDLNGAVNLSDRPKKAAVPNWLREEIIKKKSVISSAVSAQPIGKSFDSVGSEDGDKSLRKADQSDSKSIDSTRSTEDEEDEEDVEAARAAAINQEIKRVLTEVLLKVTDELFDEIATKVIDEEEPTAAVEGTAAGGNQRVSPPMALSASKATAKILVPHNLETDKVDHTGENLGASSPGGNILGLANYASDASDDEDESNSKLLSSGKSERTLHQQESIDESSVDNSMSVNVDINGVAHKHDVRIREENYMRGNGSSLTDNLRYLGEASEEVSPASEPTAESKIFKGIPSESEKSNDTVGVEEHKGKEPASVLAKSEKTHSKDFRERETRRDLGTDKISEIRSDKKIGKEKISRENSESRDSVIHEDRKKLKEKMDKREKLKETSDDRSYVRGSNVKEPDSRRSSKHSAVKDDEKDTTKVKREKYREDGERKRERARDDKEDQSTRTIKHSSRYNSRRSPSPSDRGKIIKNNSFSHESASGDEPSDNSKKRKKLLDNGSLSPSPTKSRKRQVSRSPHSKHSHRRHSPYSSSERRKRSRSKSRSLSPSHRRSASHKRSL